MIPFPELTFNSLPESLLVGLPLTEEDQKSFSVIDLYALVNPSIINVQNLKYRNYSNSLIRKIKMSNTKESFESLIKSEIKDFEEEYDKDSIQLFSCSFHEMNKIVSTHLIALKDNSHYASSFSPEFLKMFLSLINSGIVNLEGVNLNSINNILQKYIDDEAFIKEGIQTINKEVLGIEYDGDTIQSQLSINSSAILEQYFAYTYVEYLENELIRMNSSTSNVTDVIWKGKDIDFVQLVYSLYGSGLLTNTENERTKLVEQVANLLGIELGPSWLNTHSRTLLDMKAKEQPKVLKLLTQGYEKIRASKIK